MDDVLNRYRNNKCSEDDFHSAVDILLSSDKKPELENDMKKHWNETTNDGNIPVLNGLLHKIHYRIRKKEENSTVKHRLINYFSRVAAVLIIPLTIAFGYLLYQNITGNRSIQTISAPFASRTSFDLPDGSKVWLNAGSSLSFPLKFSGWSRRVKLSGQAYFDVQKKKKPFLVETRGLTVKVLGTAFDVSAYPGENTSVTLVRGKVAINTASGKNAILAPGQQASMDIKDGELEKQIVNPETYISWKDNILIFNHEPLEQVVRKLERWYNLDITIADEAIKNINVTGTFKYESISEILQLLEITEPIKYTYNKNERTIILDHK